MTSRIATWVSHGHFRCNIVQTDLIPYPTSFYSFYRLDLCLPSLPHWSLRSKHRLFVDSSRLQSPASTHWRLFLYMSQLCSLFFWFCHFISFPEYCNHVSIKFPAFCFFLQNLWGLKSSRESQQSICTPVKPKPPTGPYYCLTPPPVSSLASTPTTVQTRGHSFCFSNTLFRTIGLHAGFVPKSLLLKCHTFFLFSFRLCLQRCPFSEVRNPACLPHGFVLFHHSIYLYLTFSWLLCHWLSPSAYPPTVGRGEGGPACLGYYPSPESDLWESVDKCAGATVEL